MKAKLTELLLTELSRYVISADKFTPIFLVFWQLLQGLYCSTFYYKWLGVQVTGSQSLLNNVDHKIPTVSIKKGMWETHWWVISKLSTNVYAAETLLLQFNWIVCTPDMTRHEWDKTTRSGWWHLNSTLPFFFNRERRKRRQTFSGKYFSPSPC